MKKTFLLLLVFLNVAALSFAGKITERGPIGFGHRFYEKMEIHGDSMTVHSYSYLDKEKNTLKLEELRLTGFYGGGETRNDKRIIKIPLDENKQAVLTTFDREKLLLTVIDDDGRIRVEEYSWNAEDSGAGEG